MPAIQLLIGPDEALSDAAKVTLHDRGPPILAPVGVFGFGIRWSLSADLITSCNIYNRRWEERLGAEPGRIRTVYNGVDPANFPAMTGEPTSRPCPGSAASTRSRTWRRCCGRSRW